MSPAPRHATAIAFGAVLRAARRERGLSQEALADLGGLDRTYPSLLERGLRTPTLSAIFRLADALGLPAEYLVAKASGLLQSYGGANPARQDVAKHR